jgi:rod shape-determining protein MreC
METLLNRYRNITVLLLVIFAQLILLAYQVKNGSDVRLIRVWAVTAVTPLARTIEGARGGTEGFLHNYVLLHDTHAENERIRAELGRLKLENQFLKTELATADRAKALQVFEQHSLSKMIAARVTATAAGASASAVFVDRGSASGVEKGMGVVTPDGIVGKVLAAYPTASLVLLATDPSFAAGVVSQKNHVRGVLKGLGHGNCRVDYVQNEEKVDTGELFYTSGDDRIFPKGMPVGQVTAARPGNPFQEISLDPAGLAGGVEEVLIVLQGVHQEVPDVKTASPAVYVGPPPPSGAGDAQPASAQDASTTGGSAAPVLPTDADKIREHYKDVAEAQGHKFGDNPPGSKPVDFNLQLKPGDKPASAAKPNATAKPAAPPPAARPDNQ